MSPIIKKPPVYTVFRMKHPTAVCDILFERQSFFTFMTVISFLYKNSCACAEHSKLKKVENKPFCLLYLFFYSQNNFLIEKPTWQSCREYKT